MPSRPSDIENFDGPGLGYDLAGNYLREGNDPNNSEARAHIIGGAKTALRCPDHGRAVITVLS